VAAESPSSSEPSGAFALLGLPARFDLPAADIERAYLERSKALHPDRFVDQPAAARVAALGRATALNDAYKLLKKPVPRAEYLLAQAGVTIGSNERLEPGFLMEILELREELAEARAAGELERVGRLQASMKSRRAAAVATLAPGFAAAETATGEARAAVLADLKAQLILLRYVNRYLEECDAALDEDAA
jgi:molecular chaperone HscB